MRLYVRSSSTSAFSKSPGEQVADDAQRQLGLVVDERRRGRLLGPRLDLLPDLLEEADVALDVLLGRSLGGRADDHAALRQLDPLEDVAQTCPLVVVEPARDADALALRDVDDEAAGQRDLGGEARALRLHRVLDRLDEDLLAAADQVLDAATVAAALELGADDLVDVEEAVLLEADLDERRLHAGEDVVDDALVDVAGDRAAAGALEVDLGDAVVLEDGDTLLAHVHGDEQLALRRRQGPAGLLAAARLGAPRALLARSGGLLRPVLLRFRGRPAAAGGRRLGLGRGGRCRRFGGGALPPLAAAVSAAAPATGRLSALGGGVGLCYSSRVGVLRFGDCFDRGRLGSPSTASEPRQWQVNSPSWEARARPKAVTRRVDARSAFRSDNNG